MSELQDPNNYTIITTNDQDVRGSLYTDFSVQLCGIALFPLCIFGLAANAISALVIIRRVFQNSIFKWYLLGLCVADTGTLLSSLLIVCLPRIVVWADLTASFLYTSLVHLTPMAFGFYCSFCTMSAWMVVSMSVMRSLSLEFPFAMNVMTTYKTKLLVLVVGMTSILCNLTRFLELQAGWYVKQDTGGHNVTLPSVEATSLRRNPTYIKVYVTVLVTIVNCFIPFAMIISTNILTSIRVYQTTKRRLQMDECSTTLTNANGEDGKTVTRPGEPHLVLISMLLGTISLMFTLCNSVPFVANCIEMAEMGKPAEEQMKSYLLLNVLGDIGNFLTCVNASLNFCIYVFFNEKSRHKMIQKVRSTIPNAVSSLSIYGRAMFNIAQETDKFDPLPPNGVTSRRGSHLQVKSQYIVAGGNKSYGNALKTRFSLSSQSTV